MFQFCGGRRWRLWIGRRSCCRHSFSLLRRDEPRPSLIGNDPPRTAGLDFVQRGNGCTGCQMTQPLGQLVLRVTFIWSEAMPAHCRLAGKAIKDVLRGAPLSGERSTAVRTTRATSRHGIVLSHRRSVMQVKPEYAKAPPLLVCEPDLHVRSKCAQRVTEAGGRRTSSWRTRHQGGRRRCVRNIARNSRSLPMWLHIGSACQRLGSSANGLMANPH